MITLPEIHRDVVLYLFCFLEKITSIGEYAMDAKNLATCWAPNLIRALEPKEHSIESRFKILQGTAAINIAMTTFITNFRNIFEDDKVFTTNHFIPHSAEDEIQVLVEAAQRQVVQQGFEEKEKQESEMDTVEKNISKELTRLDSTKALVITQPKVIFKKSQSVPSSNNRTKHISSISAEKDIKSQHQEHKLEDYKDIIYEERQDDCQKNAINSLRNVVMEGKTSPKVDNPQTLTKIDKSRESIIGKVQTLDILEERAYCDIEKFREEVCSIRENMKREMVQLREAVGMNESITVHEFKNLWDKLDLIERWIREEGKSSLGPQREIETVHDIKEEMKGIREDMMGLQSYFSQLSERLDQVEYEHHDVNKRIDELIKEQRYNKIQMDYDVEHMKRLIESHTCKIRDVGMELTTMRSKMESRILYSNNPMMKPTPISSTSTSPTIIFNSNNSIINDTMKNSPRTPNSEFLSIYDTTVPISMPSSNSPSAEKKSNRRTQNNLTTTIIDQKKLSTLRHASGHRMQTSTNKGFTDMHVESPSKKRNNDVVYENLSFRIPKSSMLEMQNKRSSARFISKDDPYGLNKLENLKIKYSNDGQQVLHEHLYEQM